MNKEIRFEIACGLLDMSESEKQLARELLKDSVDLETFKNMGWREVSPAFAHTADKVYLHPVFMAYIQEELPETEEGSLPSGMELLFSKRERLYGAEKMVEEMVALLSREKPNPLCLILLENEEQSACFLAEQTANRLGMPLLLWDGKEPDWQTLFLTALLYDALICLDIREGEVSRKRLEQLADRVDRFLVLSFERRGLETLQKKMSCLFRSVPGTSKEDRETCLEDYIREGGQLPPRIYRCLVENSYTMGSLQKILYEFTAETSWSAESRLGEATAEKILAAYTERQESSFGIYRMASHCRLTDLCLPVEQERKLAAICAMLGRREQVMKRWGFEEKYSYGNGLSLLFYGAPGTGKTMAAQAVAGELGMPLYRVDLSQLISKYIGETQKNMGSIFRQARQLGGILLFDEADALFARRNEIGDAQDKYANAETAYLLQKMEEWDGICILATNLLQNFDEAFRRRITYLLNFPMPDEVQRRRLWEKVFPQEAELAEDIDAGILAGSFELSGAAVKSAALQSAYLAAVENMPIGMKHVLQGIANEYAKWNKRMKPEHKALLEKYDVAGENG